MCLANWLLHALHELCHVLPWFAMVQYFRIAYAHASVVQWSTELPVAGSSFTYVMASLGQLPAFLVTSNMVSPEPAPHASGCCMHP